MSWKASLLEISAPQLLFFTFFIIWTGFWCIRSANVTITEFFPVHFMFAGLILVIRSFMQKYHCGWIDDWPLCKNGSSNMMQFRYILKCKSNIPWLLGIFTILFSKYYRQRMYVSSHSQKNRSCCNYGKINCLCGWLFFTSSSYYLKVQLQRKRSFAQTRPFLMTAIFTRKMPAANFSKKNRNHWWYW